MRVTFPADYAVADLAGKEAVFDGRCEGSPPALADRDRRRTRPRRSGLESLAELRQEMRQQMQRDYDAASRLRLKRALLDKLAEGYDFPVPPGMVDLEFDNIWGQYQARREVSRERLLASTRSQPPLRKLASQRSQPPAEEAGARCAPSGRRRRRGRSDRNRRRAGRRGRKRRSRKGRIPQDCRAPGSARPAACGGRTEEQHYRHPGRGEPGDYSRGAPTSRLRAPGARLLSPEPRHHRQPCGRRFSRTRSSTSSSSWRRSENARLPRRNCWQYPSLPKKTRRRVDAIRAATPAARLCQGGPECPSISNST